LATETHPALFAQGFMEMSKVKARLQLVFVEFSSSTPQSNGNILSVSEQVFITAVSHMKIATST
jgi:hypothetical protein